MDFKVVASGYCFLEAPRVADDGVWFSDLLLGGLHRLSPAGKIDVFLADRIRIGGAAINEGGAIICGGRGGIAWLDPATGKSGILLDAVDGEPLFAVNDMFPDGKGGLYFGTSGSTAEPGHPPVPTSIYRLDPDGRVTLLKDGVKLSNGIGLSPDGRRLYHNESLHGTFVYDVLADGSLGPRKPFSSREDCDGLAVDSEEGVWVASFAAGEIVHYRPDGSVYRQIPLPHKAVTSLCFGGPDGRDLYVTTAGNEGIGAMVNGTLPPREASLFHARADVAGATVPRTRFRLPA